MNKSVIALFALASLAAPAAAQQATVPIDVFLEQRVAEELASDGTLLSRLGVALDIEAVGDKLIVSLVDPATHRAVASTKVDFVPADREAAVAAVTQVAANLAAQVTTKPSGGEPTAIAVYAALKDEHRDRVAREGAEYKFRQEAISFGDEIAVISDGKSISTVRNVVAYQGDIKRKLAGRDFYETVGREDLAEAYDSRRTKAYLGLFGGAAVMVGGTALFATNAFGAGNCDFFSDTYDQCKADYTAQHRPYAVAGAMLAIGGTIGMGIGAYLFYHRHPISNSEIYDLGAQYNAQLRQKYGLPVSQLRKPRKSERSFVVSPSLLGDGGGLSVMGRF